MINAALYATALGVPPAGGGGPTTTPSWIAVGTGSNVGSGTNPTPAYGTNAAGDFFVLQAKLLIGTFADPAGWTLVDTKSVGSWVEYVWTRDTLSTGGESGTVTIVQTGIVFAQAQIHTYRNVSGIESVSKTNATDGTCPGPSIVTAGNHRLAVFYMHSNGGDAGMGPVTGMAGGTWVESAAEWTSGVSGGIVANHAPLDSGGTISGGSAAVNGTAACGIGFALIGV